MEGSDLLALFDRQMRRDVPATAGARVERTGSVVRQIGADAWAGVIWSDLDESTADAAIAEQIAAFGGAFEWKLYAHDRPADLAARLLRAGFEPEDSEALMVAAVADLPTESPLPDGVAIRTVTDAAGVDLMMAVHEQAFGTASNRLRDRLVEHLRTAPESVDLLLAMAGDTPVCSARMEFHPGTDFASLWGGGTVPGWRGIGIYRALVAHRVRTAVARGVRYLQVDASDDSRPILRRLGFVQLDTTTPYNYVPR